MSSEQSNEQRRIKINSIEDAIELLEEVDRFLSNYKRALDKLRSITRKLNMLDQKPSFSFYSQNKSMEKMMEEMINKYLQEKLVHTTIGVEDEKIDQEVEKEVDELIEKLKSNKCTGDQSI